ncbi:flavodoxin family protein [Staphylococcus auricularis]|uniref:FMN-dependent NADPH-azoreductase n=1 Tax=Staphylococcus auricularis TaxID=29379 RepID=A0ABX5ICE0_9STAP|nr:flavodoxin family protein [Staphylococcus auricularis]MCE5038930.1 flavodoxin family protein [Staphylococcus auricularis]MEB6570731.1 flavodoxin family protein [Staphylococcus auricularis]PTH13379.1 flavodoxin family protein [Staphylococcus auricularis]PTH26535.1 flavodoxin family protein [Staphylococcus auricularis]
MKALILNTTLKTGDEPSHTEALANEVIDIYHKENIETEMVRVTDYDVKYGIDSDMGDGDEWPQILDKILESDIVLIGTPLWLGEKSSVATLVIERMYGSNSIKNEKGQAAFYNKVGGVIVTGNEDGAKHASASVLYGLSHIGFTIPPNVDAYWVGEAGPGPSYRDIDHENEFTKQHVQWLAYNTIHLARILKSTPIPNEGNQLDG